ncbi:TetR family transcriptional regulator [Rhizobium mongolense USDA 1844]|nr:TetR family transcriptional regulator [Rhizobium mongolense USDA 1844]
MPRHQFRGRRATLGKWPAVNPGIKSSATYFDAWVSHPERLGIELLQDGLAAESGSVALNYAELRRAEDGRCRLADRIGGASFALEPALIVNATGGWIDIVNQTLLSPEARPAPLIGGTKGSHLIIDNADLRDALAGHMIYYENEDGRICIAFPYLDKVLVGSTDIRVDNPATVRCEADELEYILQSLAFVLPGIAIRREQIVFQFSGVRPLPASSDSFTGRIPRDHFCTVLEQAEDDPPVLCMIGGKWTTFRSFGELAADMTLERLGRKRRIETSERPIGGGRQYPSDKTVWSVTLARRTGISSERAAELFDRYGTEAEKIAVFIAAGLDMVMPKSGYLTKISDIRKRELRRAAFEVLQREGMAGATLEKVAVQAGASKGIVLHYFANKQELFEHAMREANAALRDAVVARLNRATTPFERLEAIIEGNFEDRFFQPSICRAWLALCAEVPREPQLARIQKVIHARMRSNLMSALVHILPEDECESVVLGVTALIDGLWLRLALQSAGPTREDALRQMRDYLSHRLPAAGQLSVANR